MKKLGLLLIVFGLFASCTSEDLEQCNCEPVLVEIVEGPAMESSTVEVPINFNDCSLDGLFISKIDDNGNVVISEIQCK